MQRARRTQAVVLTAIAVVMAVAIGATMGMTALVLAAVTLPLPLTVLWLASDVLRADEWREQTRPALAEERDEAAPRPLDRAA